MAMVTVTHSGLGTGFPALSRARVLAILCWQADITWFAGGANETPSKLPRLHRAGGGMVRRAG